MTYTGRITLPKIAVLGVASSAVFALGDYCHQSSVARAMTVFEVENPSLHALGIFLELVAISGFGLAIGLFVLLVRQASTVDK